MKVEISHLYEKYLSCEGVSTDTRAIPTGCLFVALKGPNFDANTFAVEALQKGAKFAVVDDPKYAQDSRCLLVDDGLQALQALAGHHRSKLTIPVVGITGSNGKTTTKELMHVVLSKKYRTSATIGNLNNHIGVPLTILAISNQVQLAIVEMGANHVGEIAQLCEIAKPSHGLITNIGQAHMEGFGGFEGVVKGKSELYHYLIQNRGEVFINSQDPILGNMAKRFSTPYYYPAKGDYLEAELEAADPYLKFKSEQGSLVTTQLIGAYNFSNVAAALCIGKFFDVPANDAQQAIADYVPQNNRSQVIQSGSNTIILDAYNANPNSMSAALNNLSSMDAHQKMVILGDMLELGDVAPAAHHELGTTTKEGFDEVIYCGTLVQSAHKSNPNSKYFVSKKDLISYLQAQSIENCTILIKASRSLGLEELVKFI